MSVGVRATTAVLVVSLVGCGSDGGDRVGTFDVHERSIAELQAAMTAGEVTARGLVEGYLRRIEAFDQGGPGLNAMVLLNPEALARADELDAERAAGQLRGPLHGIPVVIKDNYDTADMATSAGAIGLATSVPPDDAFQVRRLREAGAIVLGKTNMHELARGITTISSVSGQTRNPYDPERNPGGSSGGTGAAVAASYAAVGMGSDTCGSIRIPSAHHALVGLRGTRGLASGDGIVPLSTTQDIGGPLARSVEDLALVLDATAGEDPADETTARSAGRIAPSYADALAGASLDGVRVAVVEELMGEGGAERPVREVIEAAVEQMVAAGAEQAEVPDPEFGELLQGASLIGLEFKIDFDNYLAATPDAPVRSLEELVELGLYHQVLGTLESSLEVESLDTDDYRGRLERREAVKAAVEAVLDEHDLTVLVYPTIRQTARPIGQGQPGSNCALSAVSGLPAITVPAGYAEDGMPVGLEMIGREFAELELLRVAYAFEQETAHRRPPASTPSLVSPPGPVAIQAGATGDDGAGFAARLELDETTRTLRYSVSAFGLLSEDVLFTHIHRTQDEGAGPVVHLLGGRAQPRASGTLALTAADLERLKAGELYVDLHTTGNLPGLQAPVEWPEAP